MIVSKYLVDKFSSLFISAGWFWKFLWSIGKYTIFLNCNKEEARIGFFVALLTSHYHCSRDGSGFWLICYAKYLFTFLQFNRLGIQAEVKHSQPNKTPKNKKFIRWIAIVCGQHGSRLFYINVKKLVLLALRRLWACLWPKYLLFCSPQALSRSETP